MKLKIVLYALAMLGASPALAQVTFNSQTNIDSETNSPAGIAVGAYGARCPQTSLGVSQLGIDAVVFSHSFGRCPGIQNALDTSALADRVEARFGKEAGDRAALRDPIIRKAVYGDSAPRVMAGRSAAGSAPVATRPHVRQGGGNPLGGLFAPKITYPSEPSPMADIVVISSRSALPRGIDKNTAWASMCGAPGEYWSGEKWFEPAPGACEGKSRHAEPVAVADRGSRDGTRQFQVGGVTCVVDRRGVLVNVGRPAGVSQARAERACGA